MDNELRAALQQLFADDYREHGNVPAVDTDAYRALRLRDQNRRQKALQLLAQIQQAEGVDYYHVAWLLNHGDQVDEIELAHQYATRAVELGYDAARWLSAASFDRWCMYRGLPQKFGTQIVPDGKCHRIWDVDPATTDAERALWNVPPLSVQRKRAAELTLTEPQPPIASAPDWLKTAIVRWQKN